MINYKCPRCRAAMSSPDVMRGQAETCPECGYVTAVPSRASSPPATDSSGPQTGKLAGLVLGITACLATVAVVCWLVANNASQTEPANAIQSISESTSDSTHVAPDPVDTDHPIPGSTDGSQSSSEPSIDRVNDALDAVIDKQRSGRPAGIEAWQRVRDEASRLAKKAKQEEEEFRKQFQKEEEESQGEMDRLQREIDRLEREQD